MFGTIRKHQTWLWAIIIGGTIVSFVLVGPTTTKMGDIFDFLSGNKNRGMYGMLAGRSISSEDLRNAAHEVELQTFLKTQKWPDPNSSDTLRQAYLRLFLIQKQKDLGIQISTDAAAAFARRITGTGSLDDLTERILKPAGLDAGDFDRFIRHELGLEQLGMVAGVSGKLVTPQEAETMYKLENQEMDASLIYFSATNFISQIKVNQETLGQFYTNQLANYRVPERVQVSYVKFNVTNFFPATIKTLTNLDQLVTNGIEQLGTNLFRGAKTAAESAANVRDEIVRHHALVEAHRVAGAFAEKLDEAQPHSLESFAKLAATDGLTVQTTAPFDREAGPSEITVPASFAKGAFSLGPDELFAGPIVGEDGVFVIAFQKRFEPKTPALSEIEAKVTADYRYAAAVQLAQQTAVKFEGTLTNGLAAGKTFASLCAQAGVKTQTLPPFSLSTRGMPEELSENINFSMLKQAAFSTEPGHVSPVAGAGDGAFIVYVNRQLPLNEAKMKTDLPNFLAYMRGVRQNDSFNQWYNAELRQDPDFIVFLQRLTEQSQLKSGGSRPKS